MNLVIHLTLLAALTFFASIAGDPANEDKTKNTFKPFSDAIATLPNQYQHLKELEWLIGDWVDQDDDVEIQSIYRWDKLKNFIYQKFSIQAEGTSELEGSQVIGWDPIAKKIRSWIFDSDGGFGEATWIKKDKSWIVETSQTLADGSRASSISIYTPIDSDTYTWESTGREVGGKLLPNIDPIVVKKKK